MFLEIECSYVVDKDGVAKFGPPTRCKVFNDGLFLGE